MFWSSSLKGNLLNGFILIIFTDPQMLSCTECMFVNVKDLFEVLGLNCPFISEA